MPLALFGSDISADTKEKMAKAITSSPSNATIAKRFGNGHQRPLMPFVQVDEATNLSDYVGADSWHFFRLTRLSHDFLHKPVSEWTSDESYLKGRALVCSLSVANDAAERGVKLAYDFLGKSKNEKKYQDVLQVVENQRKSMPNQRRKKVISKHWFLKF